MGSKEEEVNKMRIDTDKNGLEAIFYPYQIEAIRVVLGTPKGINSRAVWSAVNARLANKDIYAISRASIINFCNDMVKEGIFENHEITGKGGHRAIYYPKLNANQLAEHVINKVFASLQLAFVDKDWWKK